MVEIYWATTQLAMVLFMVNIKQKFKTKNLKGDLDRELSCNNIGSSVSRSRSRVPRE